MLSTHSPQGASSLYALHLPRKHPAASTELPECRRFASALAAAAATAATAAPTCRSKTPAPWIHLHKGAESSLRVLSAGGRAGSCLAGEPAGQSASSRGDILG